MKRNLLTVTALLLVFSLSAGTARAQNLITDLLGSPTSGNAKTTNGNRYIVITNGGITSVLNLCILLGCQVQGSLDGAVGQTFLVTSQNLISSILSFAEQLLGITSIEADRLLPLPGPKLGSVPSGLYDTAPVNYYGTIAWHGYVEQPAAQIINLTTAQSSFRVTGRGSVVADIDTGVDPSHPVLSGVLLQGYDFTRNQPGASEWNDVTTLSGVSSSTSGSAQPAVVQQSTAAVLDQSTAAVLDGSPYVAFGHGTMTAGMIHLVAPGAQILPLKAFSANGTGNLSNIVAALYYAVQNHANVVNMSFDLSSPSQALSKAVSYANHSGVVLVAAAGNENTSSAVYPAALNSSVVGIASTTDWDTRSSFSNYGNLDVLIAAPGENVISTYPGATYASESGTSFTSPMVAGTVALMIDAESGVNQSQAASSLSHAVKLTPDLNHGRLDVYQALLSYISTY